MSFPPGRPEARCLGGHAAPSVTVVLVTVKDAASGRRAKGLFTFMVLLLDQGWGRRRGVGPQRRRNGTVADGAPPNESTVTLIIDFLGDRLC
jgi:hypothetical protein